VENWSEEHQRPFYYNQVFTVVALSAQLLPKKPQRSGAHSIPDALWLSSACCAGIRPLRILAVHSNNCYMHAENEGVKVGEANRSGLAASAHVKRLSRALDAQVSRRSRWRLLETPGIAMAAAVAMFGKEGKSAHFVLHLQSSTCREGDLDMSTK
jgi:hypothetical protein